MASKSNNHKKKNSERTFDSNIHAEVTRLRQFSKNQTSLSGSLDNLPQSSTRLFSQAQAQADIPVKKKSIFLPHSSTANLTQSVSNASCDFPAGRFSPFVTDAGLAPPNNNQNLKVNQYIKNKLLSRKEQGTRFQGPEHSLSRNEAQPKFLIEGYSRARGFSHHEESAGPGYGYSPNLNNTVKHKEGIVNPNKSVFGGVLNGMNNYIGNRNIQQEATLNDGNSSFTPRKIFSSIPQLKTDFMSIPVSKTPYTNRKTISEYNATRDPIETFLRLKPAAASIANDSHFFKNSGRNENHVEICIDVMNSSEIELTRKNNDGTTKHERLLFTGVLPETTPQDSLYDLTCNKLVDNLFDENNSLLFAYGVTGSGKTFTMQGTPDHPGLIVRALSKIVRKINSLNRKGLFYAGAEKGVVIDDLYSLKPKYATQVEWCQDPRIILPKISPVPNEQRWIEAVERFNINDEGHSDSDTEMSDSNGVWRYSLYLSYYEVYNENIYDLLDLDNLSNNSFSKDSFNKKSGVRVNRIVNGKQLQNLNYESEKSSSINSERKPLMLRSENGKGLHTFIEGLTEIRIDSVEDLVRVLLHAQSKRIVYSTGLNVSSSRSHAICSAKLLKWKISENLIPNKPIPDSAGAKFNTLILADLAGSERAKHTNNVGDRLIESNKINVSLMTLKRCMDVLRYNTDFPQEQHQIVPYNESKLTRVFQPSLEGGSKTVMLACIDPTQISAKKGIIGRTETVNVIEFAHVASTITLQHNPIIVKQKQPRFMPGFMSPTKSKGHQVFKKISKIKSEDSGDSTKVRPARRISPVNEIEDEYYNGDSNSPKSVNSESDDEEDFHIDLSQLISATNSSRPSMIEVSNTINDNDGEKVNIGIKRTVDAEAQTEDIGSGAFPRENSHIFKKQKLAIDGSWKTLDVSAVFKQVRANPYRRRSFPNISEFAYIPSKLPSEYQVPAFSQGSTSNIETPYSDNNTTSHLKNNPALLKQANDKHKSDQKELDALRLAVLKQENRIAQINSEKSSENKALIQYVKDLKKTLKLAEQKVQEANENSMLIESSIRKSLTDFYLAHIETINKSFSEKLKEYHSRAEDKSAEKVDLLLEYFGSSFQQSLQNLDLDKNLSSGNVFQQSRAKAFGKNIETATQSAGNENNLEVEKLKNMCHELKMKNETMQREYDLLRSKAGPSLSNDNNISSNVETTSSLTDLRSGELVSFDHINQSQLDLDIFVPDNSGVSTANALRPNQNTSQTLQGADFHSVMDVDEISAKGKTSKKAEKSKFNNVISMILGQLSPQHKSETGKNKRDKKSKISRKSIRSNRTANTSHSLHRPVFQSVEKNLLDLVARKVEKPTRPRPPSSAEKSRNQLIEAPNALPQPVNTALQPQNPLPQPVNSLPQPGNPLPQPGNPLSQPGNSLPQPVNSQLKPEKRRTHLQENGGSSAARHGRSSSLSTHPVTPKVVVKSVYSPKVEKKTLPQELIPGYFNNGPRSSNSPFTPEANLVLSPNLHPRFYDNTLKRGDMNYISNKSMYKVQVSPRSFNLAKSNSVASKPPRLSVELDKRYDLPQDIHKYQHSINSPSSPASPTSPRGPQLSHNQVQTVSSSPPSRLSSISNLNSMFYSNPAENPISSFSRSSSLNKKKFEGPKQLQLTLNKNGVVIHSPKPIIKATSSHNLGCSQSATGLPLPDDYMSNQKKTGTLPLKFKNGMPAYKDVHVVASSETIPALFSNESLPGNYNSKSNGMLPENKVSESTLNNLGLKENSVVNPNDFKSPANKPSSSILSSIFQFTSATAVPKDGEKAKEDSLAVSSTPTKHQTQKATQNKPKNKNDGFMLSPFKIFYKLRSRK